MRVALVYATTHGHTARIAARLAETIAAEGVEVEVVTAGEAAVAVAQRSDAIVVAGSVHRGAHQQELTEFVTRHRRMLQDMPSGFVSVSLTAAEKDEELRAETRRIMDEFVKDLELTDWDAVDRFARDFVARARRRTQERSPGGTTSTGRGAG